MRRFFGPLLMISASLYLSCALEKTEPEDAEIRLQEVRFWAYQITEQHLGNNTMKLADSHYDLLVIDDIRSLTDDADYNMGEVVGMLKSSPNSRGGYKIVLAYIDIGEAEEYRWYWQKHWKVGDPEWIEAPDPDGWEENYVVRYWDTEWRQIIFEGADSYIDRIIDDGFDGIYLDWIEAYDFQPIIAAAEAQGKNATDEMLKFLADLAGYARSRKPGFLVIGQNATELGAYEEYMNIVDAVAQEQIWFDGEADGGKQGDVPVPATGEGYSSAYYIGNLQKFLQASKPVFCVDYALRLENVQKAYRLAREHGFVGYVSVRALNRLTETPPPGY